MALKGSNQLSLSEVLLVRIVVCVTRCGNLS
jgi:hypothetical protein